MEAYDIIGLGVAACIFVYLLIALFRPEKF
ncbi:K(+)-transporting ATPase subunit F [Desulfomicrobium salsuginis]